MRWELVEFMLVLERNCGVWTAVDGNSVAVVCAAVILNFAVWRFPLGLRLGSCMGG